MATPLRIGYSENGSERALVATPELRVERGDRIAIIGENGGGKSTLLKVIVGEIPALKGRIEFGTNVKLGYYAQGHEGLPAEGSPLSILLDTQPMGEESARTYLARFLFSGDEVYRSVGALSGGERSRLALAYLLVEGANLLVLDEPTNHLDIYSRETLEDMLSNYDGTVLFVSHDRFFIDRVATRLWEIEGGSLSQYLGNYTDAQLQKSRKGTSPVDVKRPPVTPTIPAFESKTNTRRSGVETDSRMQRRLLTAERDIAKLEGRLNDLSDTIAIASVNGDRAALATLGTEYAQTEEELDAAYLLWEELHTQMEPAAAIAPAR